MHPLMFRNLLRLLPALLALPMVAPSPAMAQTGAAPMVAERAIDREVVVRATLGEAWAAWTTREGPTRTCCARWTWASPPCKQPRADGLHAHRAGGRARPSRLAAYFRERARAAWA
jgi:hypothetical protein